MWGKAGMTRNDCKIFTLGVTGVSGSGKTTVTRILQRHGAYAVIADELAHRAILKGNPPYDAVVNEFGAWILREDGEIDRKKLGGLVFGKPQKMAALEGIIHPYVIKLTRELIKEATGTGGGISARETLCADVRTGAYRFAVIDAPMLIEAGMNKHCDRVWLITAPDELKIRRIIKRDGITREAAEKRLEARNEEKLFPFADEVIVNENSLEELEREVINKLKRFTGAS